MSISDNSTYIERQAEIKPFLDHKEDHVKCGTCTKNLIRYEVAKEMRLVGKISDDYIKEYEDLVDKRWKESFIYKEVNRRIKAGLNLNDAIKQLEAEGYYP
jgi:hypothetical protein